MVDTLRQIRDQIINEKGSLGLLAILTLDDLSESLVVIFSADWIKEESRPADFAYCLQKLKDNLGNEVLSQITRIGVLTPDHHLAQLLSRYKTGVEITDDRVNGFQVKKGYVIHSEAGEISSSPSPDF